MLFRISPTMIFTYFDIDKPSCPLRSGARGGGPAVPTGIWSLRWGPAVPTGIWSSRWRSGCAHWDLNCEEVAGEEVEEAMEAEEAKETKEEENNFHKI